MVCDEKFACTTTEIRVRAELPGADGRRGWGSTGASGISDHTEVGAKSQDASGEVTRRGREMAEQRRLSSSN